MGLFKYLMQASRRTFLLALLTSVVSGGTGAAFIAMVNQALSHRQDIPVALAWGYAAMCLATISTRFVSQFLLFRLSQGVIQDLRRRLIDDLLGASLRSVEKIGTPKLYSALSEDVVVIANALPGLPAICSSAAFLVVCLVYLVIVSPIVAAAALVTTVVGVVLYRLFSVYGLRSLGAARERQDILFEHFRAITEGIKELKLNRSRRQAIADRELDATAESYRRHSVVGLTVFEGAAGSGQAVFFVLIGVMLFVFPNNSSIPAQALADSVLIVLFAVSSLQSGLTLLPAVGRASIALRKIEERLAELEVADQDVTSEVSWGFDDWQRLEFRGVSHVYPGPAGEQFVLGPVDFEFRRGEILFVVGANGSGKTTLAKLLTGLYPPEGGTVWVDGTEVTGPGRDAYRQLFSAVFSDFFLFDSLLGLPAQNQMAKAQHYLTLLQLDHKVTIAGDRFSTTALSQGQRKRLALLVAYMEDRSFFLFDEWAADQDPVFKEFFYHELLPELKARSKAVVVISHDDRYFHVADRLVRLEDGQIRQEEVVSGQALASR